MNEEWRDIPGFEGRYQASDLGRVRSVARRVRSVSKAGREFTLPLRERILRRCFSRGYPIVGVSPEEGVKHQTIAVHLLVARTFVPNPGVLPEVNHIDGVKSNCRATNLEWTTHAGNIRHMVATGLSKQAFRVRHPVTGEVFPSAQQAARAARCRAATVRATWARV